MGTDKSAILESAQLLTARGQFDKAIAEWKKLTDGTPADGTIYNTIGDLHLKRNAPADAVEAYFKAAAAFREGEAALKAIALYKKILKVDPGRTEAHRHLGALHAERGLVSNAVADYLTLAKLYLQAGKGREALEVYRVIVSLDPSNREAQQRLAELAQPGQQAGGAQDQKAQTATESAGQPGPAMRQGATRAPDGALRASHLVGETAAPESGQTQGAPKWKPEWSRQDFINEAVRLTAADRYDDAESLLSELLGREPGDPEVCRLLAVLHLRSGQLSCAKAEFQFLAEAAMRAQDFSLAESMLRDYLAADPDCTPLREVLGRLYEQTGEAESAAEQYGKVIQALLEHPDPDQSALPAELYGRIKQLTPSSPFVSRFAPTLESAYLQQVRHDARLAEQAERPAPPEKPADEIQADAGTPASRSASSFRFVQEQPRGPQEERKADEAAREREPAIPVSRSFAAAQPKLAPSEWNQENVPRGEPARSEPADEPAHEAHYQLGVAYKNMGLLDEAVEELRLASQGAGWFLDSCLVLAACLKDQGREGQAIPYLEQALADARCEGGNALSVRYQLGLLYEAEGRYDRARQLLSTIPEYRDVHQRLERLELMKDGDQAETVPAGAKKKRRISYI